MPSLVRLRQLHRNLRAEGLQPTCYKIYYYLYGYLYDLSRGGIDTTSPATAETLQADGTPRGDRTAAFPCHPQVLRHALERLRITPEDVFLDIGCGKGRALVVAAGLPFRRLVGVDLLRAHVEIARRNLKRVAEDRFQLIQGDALAVDYPDDVTVCFLFKPFPEETIRACLARLGRQPRAIVLMGTEDIETLPGFDLRHRQAHPRFSRFGYVIFERSEAEAGDRPALAATAPAGATSKAREPVLSANAVG